MIGTFGPYIGVEQRDAAPAARQRNRQVHGDGGLPHAALPAPTAMMFFTPRPARGSVGPDGAHLAVISTSTRDAPSAVTIVCA